MHCADQASLDEPFHRRSTPADDIERDVFEVVPAQRITR
jgi:hypothetical protein